MSKTTEAAFELDADAAGYTHGEAVHFGSFPGVWFVEQPIAVSELGFDSEQEAVDRVAELGLPLRKTRVPVGSAPMPERTNHVYPEPVEEDVEADAAVEADVEEQVGD